MVEGDGRWNQGPSQNQKVLQCLKSPRGIFDINLFFQHEPLSAIHICKLQTQFTHGNSELTLSFQTQAIQSLLQDSIKLVSESSFVSEEENRTALIVQAMDISCRHERNAPCRHSWKTTI